MICSSLVCGVAHWVRPAYLWLHRQMRFSCFEPACQVFYPYQAPHDPHLIVPENVRCREVERLPVAGQSVLLGRSPTRLG